MRISDWSSDVCSSDLAALKRLKLQDENALLTALGKQSIDDVAVMEALMPGSTGTADSGGQAAAHTHQQSAISIKGLTPGLAVKLSECCHPVPGARIVGLRQPGGGIAVHTIHCAALTRKRVCRERGGQDV